MIAHRSTTFAALFALAALACTSDAPGGEAESAGEIEPGAAEPADAGPAMDAAGDGWIALFDGTDLSAWRGYQREDTPAGWQVHDGILVFDPEAGDGGDIVTRQSFDDFELELDWRIEPGGNSGIFFRADEEPDAIWHHAIEIQILDDDAHADGASALTSAGSAYALYPPTQDVVNPAGEWNHMRIVARGPNVEHWMNGTKIVEYEIGSDDWNGRVADSKFAEYAAFARAGEGRIGLQDHGNVVSFRDIRVRPIPEEGS
ncbi:MAG: DUF1080 domain-containing protein [Gemmatimonadota bacterium]